MKVLHVTTSLINGGSEAAMYRLICASIDHTHTVISITGTGMYEKLLRDAGARVYCLQFKGVGLPFKPMLELRRILKHEKPDVVQTWMYHANLFGGLIARSAGIRAVFWNIRTSNPQLGNIGRATQYVNIVLAKLAYVVPMKIVSCAHRATKAHTDMGYPARKIRTICNGYDLDHLNYQPEKRTAFRQQWKLSEGTLLIGIVARWHPQKDHQLLFKALDKIKGSVTQRWKLILIGTDMASDNEELISQLEQSQMLENCILAGPQQDIPAIMSALDVHVLTSTDEGFPNVIAEAMACQTPCLSTDAGDAALIIGDTGWISPVKDVEALSDNLLEAFKSYSDDRQWNSLRIRARERIQSEFTIEKMTQQYQDLWQQHNVQEN